MASVIKGLDKKIARMPGVNAAVKAVAQEKAVAARAELAAAGHTEHHKITTTKGDIDWYVNLEGPWAGYLEYGRPDMPGADGKVVRGYEGDWILHRAFAMSRARKG